MEATSKRIESINETLSRMRREMKALNLKKKALEKELAETMRRKKVTQYKSFSLSSLDPPKKKRRTPAERQRELTETLAKLGVSDPESGALAIKALSARKPKAPPPSGPSGPRSTIRTTVRPPRP